MKHEHIYIYNNANVPAKRNITNLPLVWFGQCAFPSQSGNLLFPFQPWFHIWKVHRKHHDPIVTNPFKGGGWTNPFEKYAPQHGFIFPKYRVNINKYWKPPPRIWCTQTVEFDALKRLPGATVAPLHTSNHQPAMRAELTRPIPPSRAFTTCCCCSFPFGCCRSPW